jgi:hypothetical protein
VDQSRPQLEKLAHALAKPRLMKPERLKLVKQLRGIIKTQLAQPAPG